MDVFERIGVIAEITRRKQGRSGRLGKTTVMKLLYLLQEAWKVPLGYRFTLYTYGPYQSDVMSDIDTAEAVGAITVNYENDKGYRIETGHASEAFACPKVAEAALREVLERFGDMNAGELELRSTIFYLKSAVPFENLSQKVREIKPKFSEYEVEKAIQEMRNSGLLVGANSHF